MEKMTIDVGDAQPIAQRPHRVPDKMKTQVEEQISHKGVYQLLGFTSSSASIET